MTELLTQAQLEDRMMGSGIARARAQMEQAEAKGEAARNPYAASLFRAYVEPLKAQIEAAVSATGAGSRTAHAKLLRPMDAWAVAYIAVRVAIGMVLTSTGTTPNTRTLGYALGKHVHTELYLEQFANLSPDLYHILAEDMGRKHSKSITHRIKVFKSEANRQGLEFVEWPIGAREQVGMFLLDCLIMLGMLEMQTPPPGPGKRQELLVTATPEVLEVVQHIRAHVELTRPVFGPCSEPPRDWVAFNDGGFHTKQMRRAHPFMVKAHPAAREALCGAEMPQVYAAINHLQKTAWRVNTAVLEAVTATAQFRNTGEILTLREEGKPRRPEWLAYHAKGEDMTEAQEQEFLAWKRAATAWYTQQKLDTGKFRRFFAATRTAEFFRDYPAIYFVWFADSRGRFYPLTQGLTPQGSDLQKGLLRFANGVPLGASGVRWFLIHGANKAGYDKAPLAERSRWHLEHREVILACAEDPVNNQFWTETDNPCQFLAWCFEYAQWVESGESEDFISYLPVSLDGSCNGLQHYSAMLRDEVGGRAVNLTDNATMSDIYKEVADVASAKMRAATDKEDESFRQKWLDHGLNRNLSKRSVMTTPYGVTIRSAIKYVIEDYLTPGKAPCFSRDQYYAAASVVMKYIWPSIGEVVIKARQAMDWLRAAGRELGKNYDDGVVLWTSPSGFLASQAYYEQDEHMIRTRLYGHARIKVVTETDESSSSRHATALAPNFVHSCDAAHLHITTNALASAGVRDLAMIHDDYGTHAGNAQVLYDTIRSTFHAMYSSCNPLQEFASEHGIVEPLPEQGSLDLDEVLRSEFFFS